MRRFRIAVIGLGKIALDQHLPVIAASHAFELAAVASQRGVTAAARWRSAIRRRCWPRRRRSTRSRSARRRRRVMRSRARRSPRASTSARKAAHRRPRGTLRPRRRGHAARARADDHLALAIQRRGRCRARRARRGRRAAAVHRVEGRRPQVASGPGLDLARGRLRRVRSGDQRAFHRDQDPAAAAAARGGRAVRAAQRREPDRRRPPLRRPRRPHRRLRLAAQRRGHLGDQIETRTAARSICAAAARGWRWMGRCVADAPPQEYAGIYRHFAVLLESGRNHIDARPFELVADAFLLGRRVEVAPFLP